MEPSTARLSFTGTFKSALQKLRSLVFPSSSGSEEGPVSHGKLRVRRIGLTVVVSLGSRVISISTTLISVPLTIHYLGIERYGMWMTMTAILATIMFADLGIGNGLINAVAEANGRDDKAEAGVLVSSATFMLLTLASIMGVGFIAAYPFISWDRVFNVTSPLAMAESGPAVFLMILSFIALIPLSVSQKVQVAYQDGFYQYIWIAVSSLLSLALTLVVIYFRGGLVWLVLAEMTPKLLVASLNTIHLFFIQRPWLIPSWKVVHTARVFQILQSGIYHFLLQVSGTMIISSNNLMIAQMIGPEAVSKYSVPMRMFNVAPMILVVAAGAVWPAYSESLVRGDIAWARKAYRTSLRMTAATGGAAALVLLMLGHWIIIRWAGPQALPDFSVLASIALWASVFPLSYCLTTFLNGAGALRFRTICDVTACLISFPLKYFMIKFMGLSGVILATLLAWFCFSMIPNFIYISRYFREKRSIIPAPSEVVVSSV